MKKLIIVLLVALTSCEAQSKVKAKQQEQYSELQIEADEAKLTPEQAYILIHKGTETPYSSALNRESRVGVYVSPLTGDTLFRSRDKFDSGTGWPSFDAATDKVRVGNAEQNGWEVVERSNGYHLGHLFVGEIFTPKNRRYCINGDALIFIPE